MENEEKKINDVTEELSEAVVNNVKEYTVPEGEEITSLIDGKNFSKIRELTEAMAPQDIAELFLDIPREYHTRLFRLLSKELAAETFVEMDGDITEELIASFTDRELSEILAELYIDDTVDIIEEMPANVVKRILRASTKEDRSTINKILRYPKDSAGTIMTTEYVRFVGDMTVEAALAHLRKVAIDKETIYTCYITDTALHLLGIVTAKQLLISPLDTKLSELMEESVISVKTTDDKEEVALKFNKYGFLALPVVDNEFRLIGIVTVDDAIDVLQSESEEDFSKMAAVTPTDEPYTRTSPFSLFLARIPWLLLLMVSATFSSTILSKFEAALPAVLILFVPMLMGTGGNSGGQSSVAIIRGISLGEIEGRDTLGVVFKEFVVGVLAGAALGIVSFGKVLLIDRLLMQNDAVTVHVAFTVSVALAVIVVIAKLIGATLPILAKKLHIDPAVMASPFITTVVDALALVLYFFVAKALLI